MQISYDPAISLLGDMTNIVKMNLEQRLMHKYVYYCTVHNSQNGNNLGAHKWMMEKENVVYKHNGVLLGHKEK
jgi:hypothetical protein